MSNVTLAIPTLNDDRSDWRALVGLVELSLSASVGENVTFDFTHCRFLRPNAVAFIGGLIRSLQKIGRNVRMNWQSFTYERVLQNLRQNGFAEKLGYPVNSWEGNSVPYREDQAGSSVEILRYLRTEWLRGWINISDALSNEIAGTVWEIYANAFEHSGSAAGVFTCGQHFPQRREVVLSVVDFGYGIPQKVRHRFPQVADPVRYCDRDLLKWAFVSGNSTSDAVVPRGLGLDLLHEFVRINQGCLEVYSNSAYVRVDCHGTHYEQLDFAFSGTHVHIALRCDENLYRLKSEL